MAKKSTLERLQGRSILAWEFDGVLGRLTEAQSKPQQQPFVEILRPLIEQGAKLASTIRNRVTQHGDLAGQSFPGYGARGKVSMSPAYASLAHAEPPASPFTPDPQRFIQIFDQKGKQTQLLPIRSFRNSAEFHRLASTRPGSYSVTGGMWRGLQARGSGQASVILDFGGSSPGTGQGVKVSSYRPRSDRDGYRTTRRTYYKQANVRNQWKGGAIYDRHRVHVLLPKVEEIQGIAEVIGGRYGHWVSYALEGLG